MHYVGYNVFRLLFKSPEQQLYLSPVPHVTGSIPSLLGTLTTLEVLGLGENELVGESGFFVRF